MSDITEAETSQHSNKAFEQHSVEGVTHNRNDSTRPEDQTSSPIQSPRFVAGEAAQARSPPVDQQTQTDDLDEQLPPIRRPPLLTLHHDAGLQATLRSDNLSLSYQPTLRGASSPPNNDVIYYIQCKEGPQKIELSKMAHDPHTSIVKVSGVKRVVFRRKHPQRR